jgi:hypothetical protein
VTPPAATATTLAATDAATGPRPVTALAVLGLLWLTGYAAACWLWPYTECRACHGTRKRRSPTGKAYRHCRRCHHTGERLRLGRQLWNHLHHAHAKGSR